MLTLLKMHRLLPLAALLLLLSSAPTETEVVRSISDCAEFFLQDPPHIPGILKDGKILDQNRYKPICQTFNGERRFFTLYDTQNKIPVFSASKYKAITFPRRPEENWKIEPQLEENNKNMEYSFKQQIYHNQAGDCDYAKQGYDRGHLFPCSYASTEDDKKSTFTLTNAVPQEATFNQGSWYRMEQCVQCVLDNYCKNNNRIKEGFLVIGSQPGSKNISNKVNVPSMLWSAFCCFSPNAVRGGKWIASAHWGQNVAEDKKGDLRMETKTLEELYGELGTLNSEFDMFPGTLCPRDTTVTQLYPKLSKKCNCPRPISTTSAPTTTPPISTSPPLTTTSVSTTPATNPTTNPPTTTKPKTTTMPPTTTFPTTTTKTTTATTTTSTTTTTTTTTTKKKDEDKNEKDSEPRNNENPGGGGGDLVPPLSIPGSGGGFLGGLFSGLTGIFAGIGGALSGLATLLGPLVGIGNVVKTGPPIIPPPVNIPPIEDTTTTHSSNGHPAATTVPKATTTILSVTTPVIPPEVIATLPDISVSSTTSSGPSDSEFVEPTSPRAATTTQQVSAFSPTVAKRPSTTATLQTTSIHANSAVASTTSAATLREITSTSTDPTTTEPSTSPTSQNSLSVPSSSFSPNQTSTAAFQTVNASHPTFSVSPSNSARPPASTDRRISSTHSPPFPSAPSETSSPSTMIYPPFSHLNSSILCPTQIYIHHYYQNVLGYYQMLYHYQNNN